jgi:hypothetical protein
MRDEPPDSPHRARLRTTGSIPQGATSTAVWRERHHPAAAPSPSPPVREASCTRAAARIRADSSRALKRLRSGAAGAIPAALDPAPPDRPAGILQAPGRQPGTGSHQGLRCWARQRARRGPGRTQPPAGPFHTTSASALMLCTDGRRSTGLAGLTWWQYWLHSSTASRSPPRLQSAKPVVLGAAGGLSACTRLRGPPGWPGHGCPKGRRGATTHAAARASHLARRPEASRDWQVNCVHVRGGRS